MTGVLIIGSEERKLIEAALETARANPTPWEAFKDIAQADETHELLLRDRKPGVEELRAKYPSQNVILGTYRAAISFEQQPAGLFRHLSISSTNPKAAPGPQVLEMVCEAFGFSHLLAHVLGTGRAYVGSEKVPFRVWIEEFEPGRFAVNVVELVNEKMH
jgi:hypothetical protein